MDYEDDVYMSEPPELDGPPDSDEEDYDALFSSHPTSTRTNARASTPGKVPRSPVVNHTPLAQPVSPPAQASPSQPSTSQSSLSSATLTETAGIPFNQPVANPPPMNEQPAPTSLANASAALLQPILSSLDSTLRSLVYILPTLGSLSMPPTMPSAPAPPPPSSAPHISNAASSFPPMHPPIATPAPPYIVPPASVPARTSPLLAPPSVTAPTQAASATPASVQSPSVTLVSTPTFVLPNRTLQSPYAASMSSLPNLPFRVPPPVITPSAPPVMPVPRTSTTEMVNGMSNMRIEDPTSVVHPPPVNLAHQAVPPASPRTPAPVPAVPTLAVPMLGMRNHVPAPVQGILGLNSTSHDSGLIPVARAPPLVPPSRTPSLGKRSAPTDLQASQPGKRARVDGPAPVVQEVQHRDSTSPDRFVPVATSDAAFVPVVKSAFLPASMQRKSPALTSSHGPLTPGQSSIQLIRELDGLPFYVAYEMYRLANAFMSADEILMQPKQLHLLRKATEEMQVHNKVDNLVTVIRKICDFLPIEKRHTFLIKTKVWNAILEEKKLVAKGDAAQVGNPKDMTDQRYGGRVRFRAELSVDKENTPGGSNKRPRLTIQLKAASTAASNANRLTKLYGSEAFLCLKMDDPAIKRIDPAYLQESLSEGIQLGPHLYHAWFIKDGTVLYINTSLASTQEDTMGMDPDEFFLWFIDRHNPPDMNQNQTVGKWAKRMQLLWSASKPGPRLEANNIKMIEDTIAPSYRHLPKPPAERDMTDGAGLMSWAVAKDIQARMGLRFLPCAVQHRTGGSKGMHVLCPLPEDTGSKRVIWLRPSQVKIKYREEQLQDPSVRTIEILSTSAFTAPARITTQLIVLLAENGVPINILVDLMTKSLKSSLSPFLEKKSTPIHMAYALEDLCALMYRRLSRAGTLLRGASVEELADEEDEYEDHPASYEESAYLCFLAGFTLTGSVYLRRKVKDILTKLIQATSKDIRFKLERSVDGKIIPDPTGKLKPGEIFVQFRREYDITDMELVKILIGDVLITRHPCKLPTDIQKMKAVDIDELHYMYDVIVMSTQGERSPASMLGGGDYDGDRATVIWDPQVVDPFTNADPSFADQPEGFQDCLDRNTTSVAALLENTASWTARAKRLEIQKHLLCDLFDDFQMQGYSNRHDAALYMLGASHPKTVEFAHKYMVSLDSSKTGVKVKASVYGSQDDRFYDREHPWKPQDEKSTGHKFALGKRPDELGPFVLDEFKIKAKDLETRLLMRYERRYSPKQINGVEVYRDHPLDEDLCRPWEELEKRTGEKNDQIRRAIRSHVEQSFQKYRAMNQEYAKAQDSGKALAGTRAERIGAVRDFYRNGPPEHVWRSTMTADEMDIFKASYCYQWEMQQQSNKRGEFPFEVAHFTLCAIKARASNAGHITITNSAYKVLRMDSRMLRADAPFAEYDDQ